MNKKFSTLLTAGLLMVGSLCSSAWADVIPLSKAENGGKYKLISSHYFKNTTPSDPWEVQTGGTWYVVMDEDGDSKLSNAGDPTVWTVSVSSSASGTMTFSFTDPESNKKLTVPYATDKSKDVFDAEFAFDDKEKQASLIWVEEGVKYYIGYDGSTNLLSGSGLSTASPISTAFMLETLPDTGIDEELNDIYNGFGFGLTAGEDVDGNLLNQQLYAVNVPTGGYKLSVDGINGKDLIIPAGTYFFTDRVWKDGLTDEDIEALMDGTKKMWEAIDWPASTILYVSPTATIETTNDNRKAGQGFQLAEAQVSEFIYEENASDDYAVGDLPIVNACFSVMEKGTSESYAIRLAEFYYQENKTDAADKPLKLAEAMNLGVLTIDDAKYLATTTTGGDWKYDFTISQDLVLDGTKLLKETKTAAVYTIQFVTGNQTQSDLFGKFLTLGTNNDGDLDWIAKSAELTNEDFPIFQYTITAVEKIKNSDKKYTKITFTNRENNQYFDVQLYPVQIEGMEGTYYSMSFPNDKKFNEGVIPVSVKRNGYGTTVGEPVKINSDVIIKLNPVTVDQYAGFAQIEDKEIRTIRYARDRYQTSNVWYAGVIEEENAGVKSFSLVEDNEGYFVDEAYDAAQFQINRVESTASNPNPSMIARTYVYWNATTKSIDHVANGDVVAAYKYQLQYVSDGTAQKAYLSEDRSVPFLETTAADANQYYIKENVDGSVTFIRAQGTFTNGVVAPDDAKEIFNVVANKDNYEEVNYAVLESAGRDNVYDYNVTDMDLNIYLDDEIPVVSWMEAAHVTLRNNMLSNGNYISMNEKNEGILVNEAGEAYYLDMTDTDAVVPSFFISKGFGSDTERMYLYNPIDSIQYQVNMKYDPEYMLGESKIKAIFKAGALNEDCDQMTLSDKGESRVVADEANADGDVWAGLKRFKFQIVKPSVDADAYYVRQIPEHVDLNLPGNLTDTDTKYLASLNEVLYLTFAKEEAMEVAIEKTSAPVANESVEEAIEGVSVIAGNGTVTIQGAAGKQVIVSNILGKVVANTVLTSDNATISVPAGIVAVAVEGEEAVKAIVK